MRFKSIKADAKACFLADFSDNSRGKAFELSNLNLILVLLTVISDIFEVKVSNLLDDYHSREEHKPTLPTGAFASALDSHHKLHTNSHTSTSNVI